MPASKGMNVPKSPSAPPASLRLKRMPVFFVPPSVMNAPSTHEVCHRLNNDDNSPGRFQVASE